MKVRANVADRKIVYIYILGKQPQRRYVMNVGRKNHQNAAFFKLY